MAKAEDTSRQAPARGTKGQPEAAAPGTAPEATGAPAASDPNAPVAEGTTPAKGTPKPRAKIVRVTHPSLEPNAAGEATKKLKEWPLDFSSVKHKALRPTDFESEGTYLRQQAKMLEEKAVLLRQQANDCDTLGDSATRAAADKMRKRMAEINELMAGLSGKGVDVKAMVGGLLQKLQETMDKKVEPAAPVDPNAPVAA